MESIPWRGSIVGSANRVPILGDSSTGKCACGCRVYGAHRGYRRAPSHAESSAAKSVRPACNRNDIHYIYADPEVCGCLYIGTQQDFAQYVSNQQLDFEQAQRITFLNYYDAAWDWGAWGPLGPVYGPGW